MSFFLSLSETRIRSNSHSPVKYKSICLEFCPGTVLTLPPLDVLQNIPLIHSLMLNKSDMQEVASMLEARLQRVGYKPYEQSAFFHITSNFRLPVTTGMPRLPTKAKGKLSHHTSHHELENAMPGEPLDFGGCILHTWNY